MVQTGRKTVRRQGESHECRLVFEVETSLVTLRLPHQIRVFPSRGALLSFVLLLSLRGRDGVSSPGQGNIGLGPEE